MGAASAPNTMCLFSTAAAHLCVTEGASAVSGGSAGGDQPGAAQAVQHLRGQLGRDALSAVGLRLDLQRQPVALVAPVDVGLPRERATPRHPGGEAARAELGARILQQTGADAVVRGREVVSMAGRYGEQPHCPLDRLVGPAEVHVARDVPPAAEHGASGLAGLRELRSGDLGQDERRRMLADDAPPGLELLRLHRLNVLRKDCSLRRASPGGAAPERRSPARSPQRYEWRWPLSRTLNSQAASWCSADTVTCAGSSEWNLSPLATRL